MKRTNLNTEFSITRSENVTQVALMGAKMILLFFLLKIIKLFLYLTMAVTKHSRLLTKKTSESTLPTANSKAQMTILSIA